MIKLILSNLGFVFNFVGCILIALSVGKHPHDAHTTYLDKKIPMAVITSTSFFWWGLSLMIAGFIISIAYSVINYIYYSQPCSN